MKNFREIEMSRFIKFILLLFIVYTNVWAQVSSQTQAYRDEPYGASMYNLEGLMDGNQIRTLFYNDGQVGQWPYSPSGEWPIGTGHQYLDGVAVLISTELVLPNLSSPIHPLETAYREWMDEDPLDGTQWGLEPVPGYANYDNIDPAPANNVDFDTWPAQWSRALPNVDETWDGLWYGYFGKGVSNSDFETFFVMDDSKDGEFARAPYSFFPIASDSNRKGLGLRVEVRGFQWSHVLAEDIVFWHYDIINISDMDYTKSLFGFYTDTGVGGSDDSDDDYASYNTRLDLAYAYDDDGKGLPGGWKTGYYGYAYLESPGNGTNGIDDDEDGVVDERRDDGIDNDGDWLPFGDLNGNGVWDSDENEPLYSDVGQDGIGPFDGQYTGPDEGEGDGLPTDGEPNFDRTDIDESDMIGLTSLSIYRLGEGGTGGGWPKDDEQMWIRMNYANFDTALQRANISMTFASGPFPLESELRERFSMALVFGDNLDDLIFNKETVQQIYNANYNFSKPPEKPTLTAVPGDGRVFLYWDSIAEESRDAFLGYENDDPSQGYKKDFEGYMIYKSREAFFTDIKTITDSKGNAKYWKPIAQFDLKNGITGPDPVGINGASFYRGDDTGLAHSYIDTNVTNGERYFYAIISYDQGDPKFGTTGLVPSECTKKISEDYAGNVLFVDVNCAVITPNAPAAGYSPAELDGDLSKVESGVGTGNLSAVILNNAEVLNNATYQVAFDTVGTYPDYETSKAFIVRTYDGNTDTITTVTSNDFGADKMVSPFDGMAISIVNDTNKAVKASETGWVVGTSNLTMNTYPDDAYPTKDVYWPNDYEIEFYETPADTSYGNNIEVNFKIKNTSTGEYSDFFIVDALSDGTFGYGDDIIIIEYADEARTQLKFTWRIEYHVLDIPNVVPRKPLAGDIFRIVSSKQYSKGDMFTFTTKSADIDEGVAKSELEDVAVVPNPYVAAAEWELRNIYQSGRGERRIDFINLPAECSIRIYTITGALVTTLHKEYSQTNGTLSWDLVSDDGMDVAYGLYIYHIDAPGVGEHIGKFAIIK